MPPSKKPQRKLGEEPQTRRPRRERYEAMLTPEEDAEDRYPDLPGDSFARLIDPRSFR